MNYPKYVEIDNIKYEINTDFRVAIECNRIAEDETIGDFERSLAIIYTLFGEKGLENFGHFDKLLQLAQKYLLCNKELESNNQEPDMDFIKDMDYIEASFMSDYNIDLSEIQMHWWKFMNLMNGLSNSELGNCCVLNRIRNLRTYDVSQIKDQKEKQKIIKEKQQVALNKNKKQETQKQKESAMEFYKALNLGKE